MLRRMLASPPRSRARPSRAARCRGWSRPRGSRGSAAAVQRPASRAAGDAPRRPRRGPARRAGRRRRPRSPRTGSGRAAGKPQLTSAACQDGCGEVGSSRRMPPLCVAARTALPGEREVPARAAAPAGRPSAPTGRRPRTAGRDRQPWPGLFGSGSPVPTHSSVAGPSYWIASVRVSTPGQPGVVERARAAAVRSTGRRRTAPARRARRRARRARRRTRATRVEAAVGVGRVDQDLQRHRTGEQGQLVQPRVRREQQRGRVAAVDPGEVGDAGLQFGELAPGLAEVVRHVDAGAAPSPCG